MKTTRLSDGDDGYIKTRAGYFAQTGIRPFGLAAREFAWIEGRGFATTHEAKTVLSVPYEKALAAMLRAHGVKSCPETGSENQRSCSLAERKDVGKETHRVHLSVTDNNGVVALNCIYFH
ncbi:MAG: hypothetical protein V4659_05870 [Pseudomonadota bacterium]